MALGRIYQGPCFIWRQQKEHPNDFFSCTPFRFRAKVIYDREGRYCTLFVPYMYPHTTQQKDIVSTKTLKYNTRQKTHKNVYDVIEPDYCNSETETKTKTTPNSGICIDTAVATTSGWHGMAPLPFRTKKRRAERKGKKSHQSTTSRKSVPLPLALTLSLLEWTAVTPRDTTWLDLDLDR